MTNKNKTIWEKQEFINTMRLDTARFQKQYGFEVGKDGLAWNNESDAFRHTYMQAYLTLRFGEFIAEWLGDNHEKDGNIKRNQAKAEEIMDLHNNRIGRDIGKEIMKEIGPKSQDADQDEIKKIIARKIVERMNSGKLILDPSGRKTPRKQIDLNRNSFSSLDLRIHKSPYNDEMFDLKNRVFYKSEFPSNKENSHLIKEYVHQYYENNGKMPTREDLDKRVRTGELIYVESYTRSDGTKVSGYYRRYPRD